MPRFTPETALVALSLQELMADWCRILDREDCTGVSRLLTADCRYHVGGKLFAGHDAVEAFYAARNQRVATQQRDGARTQRHTISNFITDVHAPDSATIAFTLVNYSAEGKAPAMNLVGPTIIADVQMQCVLVGGEWKIAVFDSQPVFVGNDPFLNASTVGK